MTASGSPASDLSEPEFVAAMASRLWPGHDVSLRTRPVLRQAPGVRELAVLPNLQRPRLLTPVEPIVAAAALAGFKTSASAAHRRRMHLAARAVRYGALRLAPSAVCLAPGSGDVPGVDEHLSRALGSDVSVSIHIGPPRAVRKPVLQLISPAGETVGFAKAGTTELTSALVAREGANLARLEGHRLRSVRVPELLHSGTWNGMSLLAQSALVPREPSEITEDLLTRAMLEVAAVHGATEVPVSGHPYLDRVRQRCAHLPASPHADTLTAALGAVADGAGDVVLRFGAAHGDWTPWNMAADGGRLLVWDWEHFESDVPFGYDAIHHRFHAAIRHGHSPREAFSEAFADRRSLLGSFQDGDDAVAATFTLYVVDIASRYVADGELDAGTAAGNVATWLAPVLREVLRSLPTGTTT